jgi:hypothetical protein
MKRIILTVCDSIAPTIIGLVSEHAVALHMEAVDQPPRVAAAREKLRTRASPTMRHESRRRVPRTVEEQITEFLRAGPKTRTEVTTHFMDLGYAPTTGATRLSMMLKEGKVAFDDTRGGYFARDGMR